MKRRIVILLIFALAIFLFWWLAYPHALSYQEQYQLFLWTGDYLVERLSVAGGLADYIGEFLTQFYYIPWLGALILALLFFGIGSGGVKEFRSSDNSLRSGGVKEFRSEDNSQQANCELTVLNGAFLFPLLLAEFNLCRSFGG